MSSNNLYRLFNDMLVYSATSVLGLGLSVYQYYSSVGYVIFARCAITTSGLFEKSFRLMLKMFAVTL